MVDPTQPLWLRAHLDGCTLPICPSNQGRTTYEMWAELLAYATSKELSGAEALSE